MRYAITGSIGTGKTTIASYFNEHGYRTYDADVMVHKLYQDKNILSHVKKMFPEAFTDDVMDKKVIANVIFNNPKKKKELEDFIHPLVKEEILKLDNCIVEVPLLFESKMEDIFDKVILVYCSKEEQIERLVKRNKITKEEATLRINSKMDINEKIKLSDFVITNEGATSEIRKQVDDIIHKL